MSESRFNPERLEELLFLSAGGSLTEGQRKEINALLREHSAARSFAARSLIVDSMLIDALAANEAQSRHAEPSTSPIRTPNHFARAAAWIGALLLIGNKSQAAATPTSIALLMKKTLTSVTTAILVLGSAGTYAIHHHNESGRLRLADMETEIQSLSDQIGITTTRSTGRRAGSKDAGQAVSIVQVQAIYDGDNVINREEDAILKRFRQQLAAMDVESLKNLLLDAEKISNPVNGRLAESILDELIRKDPAEATKTATLLSGRSHSYNFLLAVSAAQAFEEWLKKDPMAADAWYRETVAAGGLNSRNIPPNGLEEHALDRSFERLRFKAMLKSNPAEAEAMLATMLPGDVTGALRDVTDPDALRDILPKLQPEQRLPAAKGVIEDMAANDPDAAHAWAKSLGMPDRERDTLMAGGIKNAVASGKLDLAAVSEWTSKLDLDAETRSKTQIDSAVSASRLPGSDARATDWNRVTERIDWLRKEAPPESADRMVGEYLGKLAYNSRTPDQSFRAYEAEIARRGNPDPALTIAYARYLGMFGIPRFSDQGLKYLKTLPPSRERDHVIEMIEINR
jgi:hypothetical protein